MTSEANQSNHDIFHNQIPIDGIERIANYQNKTIENIGNQDVPIGSWIQHYMVTNDEVKNLINSQEINGVSPMFILEASTECAKELKNIDGDVFYNSDIENKECMQPVFVSFVDYPANKYGLNANNYEKYSEKSDKNFKGDTLTNKGKEFIRGFGQSLIDMVEEDKPESQKEDPEPVEETVETQEEIDENNENETVESVKEETPDSEKETNYDAEIAKLAEEIETIKAELAALKESEKSEEPEEEVETPESTKSRKPQIIPDKTKSDNEADPEMNKSNEERTGHLGLPIMTPKELTARNRFNF